MSKVLCKILLIMATSGLLLPLHPVLVEVTALADTHLPSGDQFKTVLNPSFPSFSKYVDPELFNSVGPTRVIVVASNSLSITEIAKYMLSSRSTPSICGVYLVGGIIDPEHITDLTRSEGVIAVIKDRKIQYPIQTEDPLLPTPLNLTSLRRLFKTKSGSSDDPFRDDPKLTLKDIVKVNRAEESWEKYNVTGDGVTIAIVDTGVDYGAVSFAYWDSVARDVKGYPAAFDADALGMVITNITLTAYADDEGVFIPTMGLDPYVYLPYPIFSYPSIVPLSSLIGTTWFSDMNVTGIISEGEEAHFGIMFQWLYGLDLFPVLVAKSPGSEIYDTVYVDMTFDWSWIPLIYYDISGEIWPYWYAPWPPDFSFADESPLKIDGWTVAARDFTGDGIYDLSVGSLGYLLDIWFLAPNIYDKGLVLKPIDPYGNYACFINDWAGHGTSAASSAAGKDMDGFGAGVAPGSKIMGVVAGWIWDVIEGQLWAAGFDLIPETKGWSYNPSYGFTYGVWNYTGNHKADVISNSWGSTFWAPSLFGLPWYDLLSMLEDALMIPGYLDSDYPGTVIVHAVGNWGAGYGTSSPPGYAALPIGVGASTSMNITRLMFGFNGGYADEVISWSGRGPTPLGYTKPDVVNVGAWGLVATPLWAGLGDGSNAFGVFGGTSMATPLTAGAASLVIQSHNQTYGYKPTPILTKLIIKSTAKDLGYDSFVQGSGRVDALSAVELALGIYGVTAYSSSTWSNIHSRLGQAWYTSSNFFYGSLPPNPPPEPIGDTQLFFGYVKPGGSSIAEIIITNPTESDVKATLTPVTYRQIGFIITYKGYTGPMPPDWESWGWSWGNLTTFNAFNIPPNADLMVASLVIPYEYLDINYDGNWDHRWGICLQDWNDADADGQIDINEVYHINYGYNWGTSNEVRVGFPTEKFRFAPLIFIYQRENEGVEPIPVPFTVHVKFYKRIEWDWLEVPNEITVNAGSSKAFNVKINVPPEAAQGVYEGQVLINITGESERVLTFPISVGVPAIIPPTELTSDMVHVPTTELYDPYALNGYFDLGGIYESGDWKTWLINIEDPDVIAAFIFCNWTGEMTDADLFVINPAGIITGASINPRVPTGTYQLGADDALNRSIAFYMHNMVGGSVLGVYTVLLHNTLFNGTIYPERISGRVELVKLIPRRPVELPIRPGGSATSTLTITTGRSLKDVRVLLNPYTQFTANITPSVIDEIPAGGSSSFNVLINIPKDAVSGTYPIQIGVFIPELLESTGTPALILLDVMVDDTPPSINILSPVIDEIQSEDMNIKVYAKDDLNYVESVEYSIDDSPHMNMAFDEATGLWTATLDTEEFPDGLHLIRINATDRAGNSKVEESAFIIDNTKPKAQISASDYLKGISSITVTGEDANFDRMELYIDGILLSEWTEPGTRTFELNTAGFKDGMHFLKLIVYDKAEHLTLSEMATIIDNTAPTGEILTPINNSSLKGVETIIVRGFDANLRSINLYVGGEHVKNWTVGGSQEYMLNTTALGDGDLLIMLVVEDMARNMMNISARVIVDNTVPSVNIESPADGESLYGNVTIIFAASDANLERVLLYIDDALIRMPISENYTYIWDTSKMGDGTHKIRVEAYDRAGNMGETSRSVNTVNVKFILEGTVKSAINTYLPIGVLIGLIVGALITWVIIRRRSLKIPSSYTH